MSLYTQLYSNWFCSKSFHSLCKVIYFGLKLYISLHLKLYRKMPGGREGEMTFEDLPPLGCIYMLGKLNETLLRGTLWHTRYLCPFKVALCTPSQDILLLNRLMSGHRLSSRSVKCHKHSCSTYRCRHSCKLRIRYCLSFLNFKKASPIFIFSKTIITTTFVQLPWFDSEAVMTYNALLRQCLA